MTFWNEKVPSLVDPTKEFPRKDYLSLTDYHAAKANAQSEAALKVVEALATVAAAQSAELTLLREDVAALTNALTPKADPTDETPGGA